MRGPRISRVAWVFAVVLGPLVLGSTGRAQDRNLQTAGANAQLAQENAAREAQSREVAESLVASREAAQGRRFDPGYRTWLVETVAEQPLDKLQELQAAGDGARLVPNTLGDSAADLVYTPITPCRIFDTRPSQGGPGPIAAGGTMNFFVAGTTGFPAQGGTAGGCGVPVGATSAMINFVAVGATAPGDLRITPYGTTMPLASFLNYTGGLAGLNLANGLAVKLCNPAVSTCTADITLQADASAVNVVADVQGYFKAVSTNYQVISQSFPISLCGGNVCGIRRSVTCPAGTKVLGGGVQNENFYLITVESHPVGTTGWEAWIKNPEATSQSTDMIVYAICAVSP